METTPPVTIRTVLFKNILAPYDGPSHSKHAFKVALDMAKKYNSKISVVIVR